MFRKKKPVSRPVGRPKKVDKRTFTKLGVYTDTHKRAKKNAQKRKVSIAEYVDQIIE